MCVWTACLGRENAAAAAWEDGCRIEGLWGGYYTGLVSLDRDGFHHGRVQGNTGAWREEFQLSDFPGRVALFHSRTPSGGDRNWAMPMVSSSGRVAIVGQGSRGRFDGTDKLCVEAGDRLLDAGCRFASATPGQVGRYPRLKDGNSIHSSELMLYAVEDAYRRGGDPLAAIRQCVRALPREAAWIFLFRDHPETVFVGNVNQRIVFTRAAGEIRLGITAAAFRPLLRRCTELPGNSVSAIGLDRVVIEPVSPDWEIDETIPAGVLAACLDYLKSHGAVRLGELTDRAIAPLMRGDNLEYRALIAYRIIDLLTAENLIRYEENPDDGSPGVKTRFRFLPPIRR